MTVRYQAALRADACKEYYSIPLRMQEEHDANWFNISQLAINPFLATLACMHTEFKERYCETDMSMCQVLKWPGNESFNIVKKIDDSNNQ
jgi:hypothetical protein